MIGMLSLCVDWAHKSTADSVHVPNPKVRRPAGAPEMDLRIPSDSRATDPVPKTVYLPTTAARHSDGRRIIRSLACALALISQLSLIFGCGEQTSPMNQLEVHSEKSRPATAPKELGEGLPPKGGPKELVVTITEVDADGHPLAATASGWWVAPRAGMAVDELMIAMAQTEPAHDWSLGGMRIVAPAHARYNELKDVIMAVARGWHSTEKVSFRLDLESRLDDEGRKRLPSDLSPAWEASEFSPNCDACKGYPTPGAGPFVGWFRDDVGDLSTVKKFAYIRLSVSTLSNWGVRFNLASLPSPVQSTGPKVVPVPLDLDRNASAPTDINTLKASLRSLQQKHPNIMIFVEAESGDTRWTHILSALSAADHVGINRICLRMDDDAGASKIKVKIDGW